MKRVVWKYVIPSCGSKTITCPAGSKPLSVQAQHGDVSLWLLVDPEATPEPRIVSVLTTGRNVNPAALERCAYVGTFQLEDGAYVGHVFFEVETGTVAAASESARRGVDQ